MGHANRRLLIVYNADSGILNALLHAVHKAFRPQTYPCSLCALTYGAVSMHRRWRRYLDRLRLQKVFHHADDFAASFPGHRFELPAILVSENGNPPEVLIGKQELDAIRDLEELIALTDRRLGERRLRLGEGALVAA